MLSKGSLNPKLYKIKVLRAGGQRRSRRRSRSTPTSPTTMFSPFCCFQATPVTRRQATTPRHNGPSNQIRTSYGRTCCALPLGQMLNEQAGLIRQRRRTKGNVSRFTQKVPLVQNVPLAHTTFDPSAARSQQADGNFTSPWRPARRAKQASPKGNTKTSHKDPQANMPTQSTRQHEVSMSAGLVPNWWVGPAFSVRTAPWLQTLWSKPSQSNAQRWSCHTLVAIQTATLCFLPKP